MFELIAVYPVLGYLFIFLARVADVSLDVFRVLMLARGYSIPAAAIGFIEVSIYLLALGTVMAGGITDPWKIIAYAAGFATGNLVGSYIEGKMALGYVVIQMFPELEQCDRLLEKLRQNNYGVTRVHGEGRSGQREILVVTAKRKNQPHILKIMSEEAPGIFFNISDIRSIRGGVFPSRHH